MRAKVCRWGGHESFVLFFGFLFVSYAVVFGAEVPAHEAVPAVFAVEKEIGIAAGFAVYEISA